MAASVVEKGFMSKSRVKILQEQVKELEKLIKLKDESIKELERIVLNKTLQESVKPMPNIVTIPSVWMPQQSMCDHEYPSPWFGTLPPACNKCGQFQGVTITYSNVSGILSGGT